jgi:hypothetical protein
VFWKAEIVHEKCVEMQLGLAGISICFLQRRMESTGAFMHSMRVPHDTSRER